MARNVAHNITFTFQGIDNLSPVASRVSNALTKVTKAFKGMTDQAGDFGKQGQVFQAMLGQLQNISTQLGGTVKPSAEGAAQANKKLASSITEASDQAVKGKGSLKELAGAYNALIVVKQMGRVMAGAIKPAMELEQAQTDLKVATGLNVQNVARLTEAAMQAAEVTVFTPPEAIEAAKRLNLSVRDTTATVQAMTPVLMMAQTYLGKNVTKASDLAASTMGAFRLQSSELEPTLNKLVAGAQAAGVQVSDLEQGMGKLGVAAGLVQTNFTDIYPAYLMAIKGGLSASEAATGLKTAMGRLADPKNIARLESGLGVTLAQGGAFSSVRDIMVSLAGAAKEHGNNWVFMANQIRQAFGDRAVKPIMANIQAMNKGVLDQNGVLRTGGDAYDYMIAAQQNSSGLLQKMNEEAMKPLGAQLQRLTESVNTLLASAFQPLAEMLGVVVRAAADVVGAFRGFITSDWGAPFKFLLIALANMSGLLLGILGPILALKGVFQIWGVAMNFLGLKAIFTSGAMQGLTARLQMFFISAGHGVGATTLLGRGLRFLGSSAKAAWAGLLGPIGLILALIEYLPAIKKLWQDVGWISANEEVINQKKEVSLSARTLAMEARAVDAALRGFDITLDEYRQVIRDAAAVEKAKMPVVPSDILNQLGSRIEGLRKLGGERGGMSGAGALLAREQLGKIEAVRGKYAAGKAVSEAELTAAQDAFNQLNLGFKGFFRNDKQFLSGMDQVSKGFEGALKGSGAMAIQLRQYGANIPQLIEVNRKRFGEENLIQKNAFAEREMLAREAADKLGTSVPEMYKRAGNLGMMLGDYLRMQANEMFTQGETKQSMYIKGLGYMWDQARAKDTERLRSVNKLREEYDLLRMLGGEAPLPMKARAAISPTTTPQAPPKPEASLANIATNTSDMAKELKKGLPTPNIKVYVDNEEREVRVAKDNAPGRSPKPPAGPFCFIAGTEIATPDGPRPIESIQVGDSVLSFDTDRLSLVTGTVSRLLTHVTMEYLELHLSSGVLCVTATHPFYLPEDRLYVEAGELQEGMRLLALDTQDQVEVISKRLVTESTEVFNMSVASFANYFAGGVLVHNK